MLTCKQYVIGSNGTVSVQYSAGGVPVILLPVDSLQGSKFCTAEVDASLQQSQGQLSTSSALNVLKRPTSAVVLLGLLALGLVVAI